MKCVFLINLLLICLVATLLGQNGANIIRELSAEKNASYCLNGGTAQCRCQPNFYGDRCETAVNPCLTHVVHNGTLVNASLCGDHGTCQFVDNQASCICESGWSGAYCQNADDELVTISKRCRHSGGSDGDGSCALTERCLPDNLNCLTDDCPNPIGWCLPPKTVFAVAESFLRQYNGIMKKHIRNPIHL